MMRELDDSRDFVNFFAAWQAVSHGAVFAAVRRLGHLALLTDLARHLLRLRGAVALVTSSGRDHRQSRCCFRRLVRDWAVRFG